MSCSYLHHQHAINYQLLSNTIPCVPLRMDRVVCEIVRGPQRLEGMSYKLGSPPTCQSLARLVGTVQKHLQPEGLQLMRLQAPQQPETHIITKSVEYMVGRPSQRQDGMLATMLRLQKSINSNTRQAAVHSTADATLCPWRAHQSIGHQKFQAHCV